MTHDSKFAQDVSELVSIVVASHAIAKIILLGVKILQILNIVS